jgi:hypothetical protein
MRRSTIARRSPLAGSARTGSSGAHRSGDAFPGLWRYKPASPVTQCASPRIRAMLRSPVESEACLVYPSSTLSSAGTYAGWRER